MRIGVLAFVLLICTFSARATNTVFLAPTSAGGNTGVDCADAKAYTYFNSSGNWSATPTGIQIGPATTVHLCSGTYTGSAGATLLTFQGSGSSGNYVTLLFDSGAILAAPYFANTVDGCTGTGCSGAIQLNGKTWIIVDGGANGIIQATANGTSLANQQSTTGVSVTGSNVIVRNLTIQNLYINQGSSGGATDPNGVNTFGIYVKGYLSNIEIANNTFASMRAAVISYTTGTSGVNYHDNTISDVAWGMKIDGNGTVNVYNNDITGWTNWQFPTATYHTDGLIIFGDATGDIVTVNVYNNYIHGDLGNGSPTAFVFCTHADSTNGSICTIYNNLLVTSGAGGNTNHNTAIWLHGASGSPEGPYKIYNNTFVGFGAGSDINTDGDTTVLFDARNNIFEGNSGGNLYYWSTGGTPFSNTTAYNNIYFQGRSPAPWQWGNPATYYFSLTGWQTGCTAGSGTGCDSGAVVGDPKLNGSFMPTSGGAGNAAGMNLTGLGITTLNSDKSGNARPSTGPWDAGAYNFTAGVTGKSRPPAAVFF